MDFKRLHDTLVKKGYIGATADAKIAHDVILRAINLAGFHDTLTVKGGVVMSGLTDVARRATMDMDVDFLHHSISDTSIHRFVSRLNRVSDCKIKLHGEIVELKQQEYRGKRIHLIITDDLGVEVRTKLDIGVHTYKDVTQQDFDFSVVTSRSAVRLLVNPKEQIFVEKLKSLLRIGHISTRFKDVYDLYYLRIRIRKQVLRNLMRLYIFEDDQMIENDKAAVVSRMSRIFANRQFMKGLSNPAAAWIDVSPDDAASALLDFLGRL